MDSMSFDAIAPVYDATRTFDGALFNAALDYIVERFPPARYPNLFEPGIGTGRIAIPLAERGYRVTGADISPEMLKILADKLACIKPPLPVTYLQQDITELPFPDASFNIAVAVHIFHLVPNWKKALDEVFRVLTPDAPLVIFFTGIGQEDRSIKDRYRELCKEYGHTIQLIGVDAKKDLPDYVTGLGRRVEQIRDRWQWQQPIRIDKFLADIRARNYSSSRLAPDDIHFKAVDRLENELKQKYGTLEVEISGSTQINMMLVLPA